MADPIHVQVLEQGVEVWNTWVSSSRDQPDLADIALPSRSFANIRLGGANLRGATLIGCDLTGAVLGGADFTNAKLDGAIFAHAHVESALFNGCSATYANFSYAEILGADFRAANLAGANFRSAIGRSAHFEGAILRDASFDAADLSNSSFSKSDLRRASFIQANVTEAVLDDALLWALRTSEWRADNLVCRAAFLDKDGQIRQEFEPGEFVRAYSSPRFYLVRLASEKVQEKLTSLHSLIELMGKQATEYSIQVDASGDKDGNMVIAVESMSAHKEKWEEALVRLNLMEQTLSVERDEKQRIQRRYDALSEVMLPDLINRSRVSSDEGRWELGLVVFFDICRFSKLNELEAAKRVLAFWRAGFALLDTNNALGYNTWGDAIVCVFKDPARGILNAWHLIESLKVQEIFLRGGAHFGRVWLRTNPLMGRPDFGGDNVNLAARVQPCANCGELLVTHEAWLAVGDDAKKFERIARPITLQKGTRDHPEGQVFNTFVLSRKHDN